MEIKRINSQSLYINKSSSVSFKNNLRPLAKGISDNFVQSSLSKSLSYIKDIRLKLNSEGKELESITQLDTKKLSGILDGLPTFKNFNPDNLGLLNNMLIINTQRGCDNGCGHCYLKAKPTRYYKEPTIGWESYKQLFHDIGELNSRLGFNVLGKTYSYAFNYVDSDAAAFCSIDKAGKKHNIAEAAEYFYKKVGKPIDFSTAGWDINDDYINNAAKDVVELMKRNPKALRDVDISIHPFQKLMLRANKYYQMSLEVKNTKPELAKSYEEKYLEARNAYVDRMAHVLKAFAPIIKPGYAHIDSQYIFEEKSNSLFTKKKTEELCKDIVLRADELCKKENINSYISIIASSILANGAEPTSEKCMYPPRKVFNTPRIPSNPLKGLPNGHTVEIDNNRLNVVVEPFDKTFYNYFENEIAENITTTLKENPDSFSKIILNIDLNNNISKRLEEAGFLNKEESLKNFYERIKYSINSYLGIPKDKLQLRIQYNPNKTGIVSLENIKEFLHKEYPTIKDINIRTGKDNVPDNQEIQNHPTAEIVKMLEHLPPETRKNFISRMKKAIDIDGNLVLIIYNKPYFGTIGHFQDVCIKVDDITLDTHPTYKDKPFTNLLKIKL